MSPGSPEGINRSMSRRPRTSTGTIEEAEKSIRGYRHIVQEMTSENALLKSRHSDLEEEIVMLKEEIKLLQDINESDAPASSASSVSTTSMRGSARGDAGGGTLLTPPRRSSPPLSPRLLACKRRSRRWVIVLPRH